MSEKVTKVEIENWQNIGGGTFFVCLWLIFIWMAVQSVGFSIDEQTTAIKAHTAAYMVANDLEYKTKENEN